VAKKLLPIVFIALIFFAIPLNLSFAQNINPQITFGDILNNTYQHNSRLAPLKALEKQKKIKAFLALIEKNGQESLKNFYAEGKPPETDKNTLTDNVAGYFITPVPTLAPRLAQILAQINSSSIPSVQLPGSIGQGDVIPQKSNYSIAILGDSMTATLGENLPHLATLLQNEYPKHKFTLLNYGQGSTSIEDGLFRLTNPTKYLNRDYPPLLHLQPDIIIVESFAYNHWSGLLNDLNRHWLTTVNILETIKNYSKDIEIILLATISPNPKIYGDGVLNWPNDLKWDSAITTKAYLQNFINFAASAHQPLADAYNPSLNPQGHGDPGFINAADHLHPSEEGKQLIARKIFETIKANNLIK